MGFQWVNIVANLERWLAERKIDFGNASFFYFFIESFPVAICQQDRSRWTKEGFNRVSHERNNNFALTIILWLRRDGQLDTDISDIEHKGLLACCVKELDMVTPE